MNPQISAIVPVYNCEAWLEECVASILNQTYTDFELILIDDGSTDRSREICLQLASSNSKIRTQRKPNGGVSSARNMGLDMARGEYVTLIDADDYVEETFFEELYAARNGVSLVVSASHESSDTPGAVTVAKINPCDSAQFLMLLKIGGVFSHAGKLYEMATIHEHQLHFDEQLTFGEDFMFQIQYLTHIKNLSIINRRLYHYRRIDTSLSSSYDLQKVYSYCVTKNYLLKFVKERDLFHGLILNYIVTNILSDFAGYASKIAISPISRKTKKQELNILTTSPAFVECLQHIYDSALSLHTMRLIKKNKLILWQLNAYILLLRRKLHLF